MTISTRNKIMERANELFFDMAPNEDMAISAFLDFSDFIDPCFEIDEIDATQKLKETVAYLANKRWEYAMRDFDHMTLDDLEVVHYAA